MDKIICRNCQHAHAPRSSNGVEQKGNAAMAKMGYRACSSAKTPAERARWATGGCECAYPERFEKKLK